MNFTYILDILLSFIEDETDFKVIQVSDGIDPFFKGDMDGKNIWISSSLTDEEKVFDILHMLGHCVQWASPTLYELGSVIHENPSPDLLRTLQEYEWEANCYALFTLHYVMMIYSENGDYGNQAEHWMKARKWLNAKYVEDSYYLTHFYKTGEKVKKVTPIAYVLSEVRDLEFRPYLLKSPNYISRKKRNDGLVINFNT